jgi:hypothetical protein
LLRPAPSELRDRLDRIQPKRQADVPGGRLDHDVITLTSHNTRTQTHDQPHPRTSRNPAHDDADGRTQAGGQELSVTAGGREAGQSQIGDRREGE